MQLTDLGIRPWHARFVNPRTAAREHASVLNPAPDGTVSLDSPPAGPLPSKEDWILLLEPDHHAGAS